MKFVLLIVLVLAASAELWVRFAPTDPARWNVRPAMPAPGPGDWPETGGFKAQRIVPGEPGAVLAALDAIARNTPRTKRIAGSPGDGLATYVTRSRLWGFPDYTTISALPAGTGTKLGIHARLRYGTSDFGVNRARVEAWLDALGA